MLENKPPIQPDTIGASERFDQVLAEYLHALERGAHPDRDDLLARNSDLADDLREFFRNYDQMAQLARPICNPSFPTTAFGEVVRIRYFGDYEVLEEIARGGMGVVFKARQVKLNRLVAIKMILAGHLASPQDVERFYKEAEAAAKLDHPGIVPIYEVGEHAGQRYFSMGYVEGQSLATRIAQGPLPAREAAELLRNVAEAVQYAHDQGVIHRDLKPGNILLDRQDKPRVTDFGLAKLSGSDSELTGTGQILGTPGYMPPEQAAAHVGTVGNLSDIYSLGALLYCVLTGRPPFQAASTFDTLLQVQNQEPAAPRQLNPAIPLDLDTIVLKCLEKFPGRRYVTAQAVADELQRFLDGRPILARPISRAARLWRWCFRNRIVTSLAVLLLASLLTITGTASVAYLREVTLRREIENKNLEIGQTLDRENAAKDEATRRLYRSLVNQAKANRLSRRMGQRFETLEVLNEASRMAHAMMLSEQNFLELRNLAISCFTLADVRTAKEWNGVLADTTHIDFDGTQERYVRSNRDGNVSVRRVADDAELWSMTGLGPIEAWPTISSDGCFLAIWASGSQPRFKLWRLAGRDPTLIAEGPGHAPVFSPNNKQMAILHTEGSVSLIDLPSRQRLEDLRVAASPVKSSYDPQSRQLAISSVTGIEVLEIETGKVVAHLPQNDARFLEWHPSGKSLAVLSGESTICIWDVESRKQIGSLKIPPDLGTEFAFSHSGDILAIGGWSMMLRLWNPLEEEVLFQTPMPMNLPPRFHLNDQHLASTIAGDGVLRLLEVADVSQCYRTLYRDPILGRGTCFGSAVSPDNRILAAAMSDGIALWDFPNGKQLDFLHTGTTMRSVRFEPSGALLATGFTGLMRWSIEIKGSEPGVVRIGPMERLSLPVRSESMGMSRDGQVIAQAVQWGGLVLHRNSPDPPLRLPHDDTRYIDVSPDGRWVATGAHLGSKVRIWDAVAGTMTHEIHFLTGSRVRFSSDGRWLLTDYGGNRLWSVGSWKEVRKIGGELGVAFSPDGRLLAVETGMGMIRLINPDTGSDYAVLEDPHQDRANHLDFSPDGTQLTATSYSGSPIHTWNLRSIRSGLSKMGLDWELPPFRLNEGTDKIQPLSLPPVPVADVTIGSSLKKWNGISIGVGTKATWSADSRAIVYGAYPIGNGLKRYDFETKTTTVLKTRGKDPAMAPGKSGRIAFVTGNSNDEVVWLIDGEVNKKIGDGGSPQWLSDGQSLVWTSRPDHQLLVLDVMADSPTQHPFGNSRAINSRYPILTADGQFAAYADRNAIVVQSLKDGTKQAFPFPGNRAPKGFIGSWHPEGKRLAFGSHVHGENYGIWVFDSATGESRLLFRGDATMPMWSPDGKRLAIELRDEIHSYQLWVIDVPTWKKLGR
jgi:serine/threonine protein kinase/WD40 repeat protein